MSAGVESPAAETRTALVRRARRINRILAETYPTARSELDFTSPWQLLVVTVLSAQTTDKRVNQVSPALFARYPGPAELAAADREQVEQIIASTGFFRAKTQSIMKLAAAVLERFAGDVPATLDELVTLP
ncbi:MAG: endonuclease III domain-containing protein, partial [Nocardioidaceae bacterium]